MKFGVNENINSRQDKISSDQNEKFKTIENINPSIEKINLTKKHNDNLTTIAIVVGGLVWFIFR